MNNPPPYIQPAIRARAADLGWSIDDLARRAGLIPSSVHRALNGRIRSDIADKLIAAMGGLQQVDGALVWGEPAGEGESSCTVFVRRPNLNGVVHAIGPRLDHLKPLCQQW